MKKIAFGVLTVFALAAGVVFLLRSSEEERIEKLLRECADAAEKGNADAVLRHVAPSCTLNGSNYQMLAERLRRDIERIRGARVEIGVAPQVEKEEAEVHVQVRVRAAQVVLGEEGVTVRLKKMNGEWKIVKVDEVR